MSILAGENVTAARLNRMQPTTYYAVATSDLVGAATGADVVGATVTFSTTAANAVYVAQAIFDFDTSGAGTTTIGTGMLAVDGSAQAGQALLQVGAATANDRATAGQQWRGTLAATGSHTIKLTATIPANMEINATHTTLLLTVYEVV
ncbi:MAG TPA: hypothetical protein VIQ30_14810 [Pseudonocardia sp.]